MARRGADVKLKNLGKNISDLAKEANSASTPINNAAGAINKLSGAASKFKKDKVDFKVDITTQSEDIVKPLETLSNDLKDAEKHVSNAGDSLDRIKKAADKFKKKNPLEGLDVKISTQNNNIASVKKLVKEIAEPFNGQVSEIEEPFKRLEKELSKLPKIQESINSFSEKINKGMPQVQNVKISLPSYLQELFSAFKNIDVQEGMSNLSVISDTLSKYSKSISKLSLPNEAMGNGGSVERTAQTVYNLLDGFRGMDVQAGLNNMDVISGVLSKYTGVLRTLLKVGTLDSSKITTNFEQLSIAIKTLSENKTLIEMSQGNTERFGAIGRVLKNLSSFINSMVKGGDFSGFITNIRTAIPAITEFINGMSTLTNLSSFPNFERVANSLGAFNGRLRETSALTEHASRSFIKLKAIMRQIYTAFVGGAVVYSIVRTIKNAIKEMFNLEYAMARVNTIARVSSSELKNMTHYVQEMSATYGLASSKVTKALYDINSATIKGTASLKILEQSAKLAVAGFTDIEKVTDLLAKAVNAYQYSAAEASKISDILFVTVERGINPMEELSEYMGRLFTVAANAGVSLEEVGAGLATLTARGYQTNIASTALNSAILKLSTGTKELNKLFNQYGFASSASALRTMGLTGAIQILYKATGGATEKLHDLGFNYRDIRAATTLASGAISEYTKTLALMNDETYKNGITNEALSKVQDTVIFKFNKLKETYTVFIQTISEYLNRNETIKNFLTALTDGINNVIRAMRGGNLSFGEQLGAGLVTLIPKLLLVYAAFKPVSKIVSGLIIGSSALRDSIKGLHAPVSDLNKEVVFSSKVASSAKYSFDNMSRGFTNVTTPVIKTTHAFKNLASELSIIPQVASKTNIAMNALVNASSGTNLNVATSPFGGKVLTETIKNHVINVGERLRDNKGRFISQVSPFSQFISPSLKGYSQIAGNENIFGYDASTMYSKGITLSNDKLIQQFSSMKQVVGETSAKVKELGTRLSVLPKMTSGLVLSGTGMRDFPVGSLNMTQPLASLGPSDALRSTVNIASTLTPIKAFAETAQISIKGMEATTEDLAKRLISTLPKATAETRGFRTSDLGASYSLGVINKGLEAGAIGEKFDAHGISKGLIGDQTTALIRLLTRGIDPNRAFYTAPFTLSNENRNLGVGLGTATNGAYKEGLATLVSNYGKSLKEGIGSVFINNAVADSYLPILRKTFPDIRFENIADQQRVLQEMADAAKKVTGGLNNFAYGIKDVSNKTNAISIGLNGFRRNLEGSSLSNIGLNTTAISKINDQFNIHPAMYTGKLDTTISSTSGILGALQKDLPNLAIVKNKLGGFGSYSFNPYTQMPFDSIRSKLNAYDMSMYGGNKGFSAQINPSYFNNKMVGLDYDESVLHSFTKKFNGSNLASELKYVENAAKKTQISFNGMTKSIDNLTVKGDKLADSTSVIKTQFKNIEEAAKKTGYSVNNVSSGLVLSGEAAEKTAKELTKAQMAVKAFGGTIKSAAKQFGMMYLQMAMVQGVISLIGDATKLQSEGYGFKETFSILGDNLGAGLAGAAGKFVDILSFGLTNFGEQWSSKFMNTSYVDEEAIKASRGYSGDFNKTGFGTVVASQIKLIKEFDLITNSLSEEEIMKTYNEAIDSIQREARSRKVSKEQLESAIKVASEQRDLLLSYNDALKKLLPNTQALGDVFAQASKNIEDSVEKFASPMEKQIREIVEAETSVKKIAELTGFTEEQIRSGGSSVGGFASLTDMIKEQMTGKEIELANLIAPAVGNFMTNNTAYKNQLKEAENIANEAYVKAASILEKNMGLSVGYTSKGAIRKYSDEMLETMRYFDDKAETSRFEGFDNAVVEFYHAWNELNKIKKMPEFEKYSLGITSFMEQISHAFTPEQMKLLEDHSEDIVKAFVEIPDEYKNDPQAISKKLLDIIADPELAKQLDILGKTYLSSVANGDKFRKSISKVGMDLAKLGTELSPEGIVGNKFNLQSVREIKDRLKSTVYDPKTILDADLSVIDDYAKIAMTGIVEHNPVNMIVENLVTAFKENDALKEVNEGELKNRAIAFIGAMQQIGNYTGEFVKQLSETDYTKAMNKMRFGSELSVFKQYKMFGKGMISDLLGMNVLGAGGASFGELLRNFEADTQLSGFNTARDNMIARFGEAGETVWTAFADLFKDLVNYEKEYINPLNTEYRNLKKRGMDFVKNYKDSMLTPIEQFRKTEDLLNKQLARIKKQSKDGEVKPESIKNAMDSIEKLYKLNEEVMSIKVPATVTASEFVKTGSKEAFDMVATNIFRDVYKVNVEQRNLQKDLVKKAQSLIDIATNSSKKASNTVTKYGTAN